ncbi:hypothetical protein Lal_00000764 [Lupinus albus]|nr:hypothetical protein Lal_00000764 [Lupinus albus]
MAKIEELHESASKRRPKMNHGPSRFFRLISQIKASTLVVNKCKIHGLSSSLNYWNLYQP